MDGIMLLDDQNDLEEFLQRKASSQKHRTRISLGSIVDELEHLPMHWPNTVIHCCGPTGEMKIYL